MKTFRLHPWNLSCKQAVRIQKCLAGRVRQVPITGRIRHLAGIDCAFGAGGKTVTACAAVLEKKADGHFDLVEAVFATRVVTMPYVPGLLSFREGAACIAAAAKLKTAPDVFIVDGQGLAHPRRLGLACHLGLLLDAPTIGCAKSRLTGTYRQPGKEKGRRSRLLDAGEAVGAVVRTRTGVKPVFVSVGHLCTLEDAVKIVLASAEYRIPEPVRAAHNLLAERLT